MPPSRQPVRMNLHAAIGGLLFLVILLPRLATAQKASSLFTVVDDIGLTQFDAIGPTQPDAAVTFSPDDRFFLVLSERGRLDLNRAESSIRIYRVRDAAEFLSQRGRTGELDPLWTITKSTYKWGPIITDVRWLADSSGLAFLAKSASGTNQLFLADIQSRTVEALTDENEHVTGFDVHSNTQFVYTLLSPAIAQKAVEDKQAAAIRGTGRSLYNLLFPEDATKPDLFYLHDLSELWAIVDGNRFRVVDTSTNHPLPIHLDGQHALALSPDGHSVVTALAIGEVPVEWETQFPPPFSSYPNRVRAGHQNPDALAGFREVSEYVLIDLHTGKAKSLTHAPIGSWIGWFGVAGADWSNDGHSVLLSNTFLPPDKRGLSPKANRPCVAVADLLTDRLVCLDISKETPTSDRDTRQVIFCARFVHGNSDQVTVTYSQHHTRRLVSFNRNSDRSWRTGSSGSESIGQNHSLAVSIKEGINDPPVLVATDKATNISRVIWDPNPQLKDIVLGQVSVLKWKDKNDRNWVGGLYKPPDYVQGKRYPLVIQTHGFREDRFSPNGIYPTTFAAQELATSGLIVLQVEDCSIRVTPEEGPCQVAGYEAAVERLTNDGLVDPDRIGISGFSRTCYYMLETLTTSDLHFNAALIADGINKGYFQYLLDADLSDNASAHEADSMIGAPPFGPGLQLWLTRSPDFKMDKVTAPLEVVATAGQGVLLMWEPYATLRYLHKPVDLLVINSDEHVFTNPANRLISQGNAVDWFRFWLKGEEDPDPAKAEQYARWRELSKLQQETQKKAPKH
jgi:dipeptidyl aminopeptidase/acylaminoacyl peptidase